MNETEILARLSSVLENVVKKPVSLTLDTDLIGESIIDSLDGMVFMLEVEQAFGKSFPEEINLVTEGYYRVRTLVDYLNQ
jgi:acyl carrier protein